MKRRTERLRTRHLSQDARSSICIFHSVPTCRLTRQHQPTTTF